MPFRESNKRIRGMNMLSTFMGTLLNCLGTSDIIWHNHLIHFINSAHSPVIGYDAIGLIHMGWCTMCSGLYTCGESKLVAR